MDLARSSPGRPMDSYHRWMEVVAPVTLWCRLLSACRSGSPRPGGHLPMDADRGRRADDLSGLALAQAFERASPWIAAARLRVI